MPIVEAIERLVVVLGREEDLYLRLRDVLRREEQELLELDADALTRTVEEKNLLVEEGRLLEGSRAVLAAELGAALGCAEERPGLGLLIELLGDAAGPLPELHARLEALVHSTRALVEFNQRFSDRSLRRVQETLRLLGRSAPEASGYGPGPNASGARGRLVRQAI